MPNSNRSSADISNPLHSENEASVADEDLQNHDKRRETPFAGEKELDALGAWLDQKPSSAKSWCVLRALVAESRKKVDASSEHRRFTDDELCVAASVGEFDWRTIEKWWEKRQDQVADAIRAAGLSTMLGLDRDSGGGRGNTATSALIVCALDSVSAAASCDEETSPLERAQVQYRLDDRQPVRLSGPLRKRIFSDGTINVGSGRHNVLRWRIMTSGMTIFILAALVLLFMILRSRPLETQELALLLFFGVVGRFWWVEWRPVYFARQDRITPLPDSWLHIDDLPAQLERSRTASGEVIRVVRYTASCPVCGSDLYLSDGGPKEPRRTVGRCLDAPREHVFSFDPVSHRGRRIE